MQIDEAFNLLNNSDQFKVIKKVDLMDKHVFREKNQSENTTLIAVIDTETTGFSVDNGDRIIDLSIAVCEFSIDQMDFISVVNRYDSLEDPEFSIPIGVTDLTGINDAMVKGKKINDDDVYETMKNVSLSICHNAEFDRQFLEFRFPFFKHIPFACSFREIDWNSLGISSLKLDYLGFYFGYFHEAHRAKADVDMLITVLNGDLKKFNQKPIEILYQNSQKTSYRIYATNLPYHNKDIVKASGYKWNADPTNAPRAWWTECFDLEKEKNFLKELGSLDPLVIELNAKNRYTKNATK